MRILSLNAWGGRLSKRLIPFLTEVDADILCLQEVTHTPASETEWFVCRDNGTCAGTIR
jgi:hypothetical protein